MRSIGNDIRNIAVAIFSQSQKYSEIPTTSEIMLTSTMVLPDYVCLDDIVNHPEPRLLIASQTPEKSDQEIHRLLDNLINAFSLGISLLNSH